MTREEYENLIPEFDQEGIFTEVDGERVNIMEESERLWLPTAVTAICRKVKPQSVLEVGFGLGISCQAFQDYGVQRHIILEPNKEIARRAMEWARDKRVEIVTEFVQDYRTREQFDLIYDDRYELVLDEPDWDFNHKYLAKWTDIDEGTQAAYDKEHPTAFEYTYNRNKYIHHLKKK